MPQVEGPLFIHVRGGCDQQLDLLGEVPVHEGLGGRAAGLPSVGTGKGELLYKPAAAHFGRHFGPALQLRPNAFLLVG